MISTSLASRPLVFSIARSLSASGAASSGPTLKPNQPLPTSAVRLSAGPLSPPKIIGRWPPRAGLGKHFAASKFTNSPWNVAASSDHSRRIKSIYSRVRCARRSNGIPSAANSSALHPIPTPSAKRPSANRSRLAISLASTSGLCSGTRQIPVASRIRLVTAAANASVMNGSSQSDLGAAGNSPLAAYGYLEFCRSNSTTCSATHSVANPLRSACSATLRITRGVTPVPIPIANSPIFIAASLLADAPASTRLDELQDEAIDLVAILENQPGAIILGIAQRSRRARQLEPRLLDVLDHEVLVDAMDR